MRFRSLPTECEAVQWNGPADTPAVEAFTGYVVGGPDLSQIDATKRSYLVLRVAQHGQFHATVEPGDWVVAEPDGTGFYPCAADVFAARWEPVPDPSTCEHHWQAMGPARGEGDDSRCDLCGAWR